MATDSDRITRVEAIAEQTTTLLDTLQRGQESLRSETQAGDNALRVEMQAIDAKLSAEMQAGFREMQVDFREMRATMESNLKTTLLASFGIGGTILAVFIASFLT